MIWDNRANWVVVAAGLMSGLALGAEPSLDEQFRDPPPSVARPSVALRLALAKGGIEPALRQLEHVREMGAGGVLVTVPMADEAVWAALAALCERCRQLGLELGVRDFLLSAEEAAALPRAQKLVWSSRLVEGSGLTTNLLPLAYGPDATYQEVARLAVPVAETVQPHQVVDLTKGPLPSEGLWRVLWFGRSGVEPPMVDVYEKTALFRHVNQALFALQSRLEKNYGTALLWYQCVGVGNGDLAWPRDMDEAFLKRSGLGLARHLPALAGVPLGGEATAAHVRRQVALTLREAWRGRYAENVRDLVFEAGLDAGIAVEEAPVEPEEVALYFRRPTLSVARNEAQRTSNIRAAGGARTMARRFVIGRLALADVAETSASALLAFPFKHELDSLFADGATRLLLDAGDDAWSGEGQFAQGRQACRYAQRCQVMLQQGEAVADVLVWAQELPHVLEGLSCDYVCQQMLATAKVKAGRLRFDSERSYGVLAVTTGLLRDPTAERLARQLATKGLGIWLVGDGGPDEADIFARAAEGERRFCKAWRQAGDGGVVPDFVCQAEVQGVRARFLHRRSSEAEVYFVMNSSVNGGPVTCLFRDTGKGVPERWDPQSGEVGVLQEARPQADGRVSVPLYLGPHDACFVVFDR